MRINVAPYKKFIVAVATAVSVAVTDGVFDVNDGITIALAVAGALGVYQVSNASAIAED